MNISAKLNAGQCILYIKKSIKSITPPKYTLSIAFPIAPPEIKSNDICINFSGLNKAIMSRVAPIIIAKAVKKYLLNIPPSLKSPKLMPVFLTKVMFKKGKISIF